MGEKGPLTKMVYVVDDDAAVRRGIERLLRVSGYNCRLFESAKEYLEKLPESASPVCMLLDIRMPEISGTELQQLLRGTENEIPIVFVTGHGDIPTCVKALKAGAVSFLSKPFDEHELLRAVEEALKLSARDSDHIARRTEAQKRHDALTRREREVFKGVVDGLLNKQIASAMGISEKTVKVHRGRVMQKMSVDSVADLVRIAQLLGDEPVTHGNV